jgi:hypothetical protein
VQKLDKKRKREKKDLYAMKGFSGLCNIKSSQRKEKEDPRYASAAAAFEQDAIHSAEDSGILGLSIIKSDRRSEIGSGRYFFLIVMIVIIGMDKVEWPYMFVTGAL